MSGECASLGWRDGRGEVEGYTERGATHELAGVDRGTSRIVDETADLISLGR